MTSPGRGRPPSRPEPPGTMRTGHRTNPRHRLPRRPPPHPRRRPPSPTYRQRPPPARGVGYSPRARALLQSGRYSNVPWPTMARQRDRHHARPGGHPIRGSRGPHHPAQSPQGHPPAGGQTPGPRPGPNHVRAGGLPPGTGHALPGQMDAAPLAVHGDRALDLGHPHRPHTNRGRPRHAEGPPPQGHSTPSPAGTTPSTGSSAAWALAQS